MDRPLKLQVNQRGLLTLPKTLRDQYHIQEGDQLTLLDLGGVFVLSTSRSEVDRLADQIRDELLDHGESLESMLNALREARQRYDT